MSGRPKADIWEFLSENEKEQLKNNDKFFIWGCQPSLEKRWERMQLGDYVLFYAKGKFVAVGELQFKKKDEELAKTLWPISKETREPWSCVFFVQNLATISLPIEDFAEMTGYKMDRVQGFMRVSKGLDGIVKRFGSTDNFIESLRSGLDLADVKELSQISEKSSSKMSPEDQARFDDLTRGKSDEEIEQALQNYAKNALNKTPEQITKQVTTYKRNRRFINDLKQKHKNQCQICGFTFTANNGNLYSEAAHIIPISSGMVGVDSPDNIWILCPNHHKMLDFGAIVAETNQTYKQNGETKQLLRN